MPLKSKMDSQEASLKWVKSKQNKIGWIAKGWAAPAYKCNCSQILWNQRKTLLRQRKASCAKEFMKPSLCWSLKSAVLKSLVWLISILLYSTDTKKYSFIYLYLYVLIWLTENACAYNFYILIEILYISLSYSRVLREQDCMRHGFFPNRNQIQMKYKGYSNESLDTVLE